MLNVTKLYPQYKIQTDRRQQNIPVEFERRSGRDRRSKERIQLDTTLTRDIFEVKSKISKLQSPESNQTNSAIIKTKAVQSFQKSETAMNKEKPSFLDTTKAGNSKKTSPAALTAGLLACTLGGVIAANFMGPVGAVAAIGIGVYLGGKAFKNLISTHLRDK